MSGIIDFHSHVLPEMDDGSSSVEESILMLRQAASQGIHHVVATPHFYPRHDTPEHFLAKRKEAECRLRGEMQRHPGLPRLSIGAEVRYFPGMSYSDALSLLTIDEKKCILIEMPEGVWTESMYRELEEIRCRCGIIPVIAHVDRYIHPFRTHHIPERLSQLPVLVQANAGFFLHRRTRRQGMTMLRKGQIHLLGSDCHDLERRPPNLGAAVEGILHRLGSDAISRIQYYGELALGEDELE